MLETINGHEVIAMHRDYSATLGIGGMHDGAVILVRTHKDFVTARYTEGETEWDNGRYFTSYKNAVTDFHNRVQDSAEDWT